MEDLNIDIVTLVLEKVSDYCSEHESCKGCKFSTVVTGIYNEWYDCEFNREPSRWNFKEGTEK